MRDKYRPVRHSAKLRKVTLIGHGKALSNFPFTDFKAVCSNASWCGSAIDGVRLHIHYGKGLAREFTLLLNNSARAYYLADTLRSLARTLRWCELRQRNKRRRRRNCNINGLDRQHVVGLL